MVEIRRVERNPCQIVKYCLLAYLIRKFYCCSYSVIWQITIIRICEVARTDDTMALMFTTWLVYLRIGILVDFAEHGCRAMIFQLLNAVCKVTHINALDGRYHVLDITAEHYFVKLFTCHIPLPA